MNRVVRCDGCSDQECKPGCVCNPGFILDPEEGRRCIPISQCPKIDLTSFKRDRDNCMVNSHPLQCRSCCAPPTCVTKVIPNCQICPAICVPGCSCHPGFILDKPKGRCIRIDQCPQN
ncbi:unnamed protein product [Psylliodes chrysocephalus]|uniref:TIL domain-containing protein n=1 Tax=Psylliodes chrysocephalus TaxID=3402493 RepID=A0A9P0CXB1_9CUCU|nr:unnamed protein product [Psylliodes chrysocephala]